MNELELLKNKIKYRASYRGTKEMDILLTSFVSSVINKLEYLELLKLDEFLNLNDEDIYNYLIQDNHNFIVQLPNSENYEALNLDDIFSILKINDLQEYYGIEAYNIFYECKQNNQWTLDRIDNSMGHNTNNVVISCLECNLKRRDTEMNKFKFTKQLNIKKIQ